MRSFDQRSINQSVSYSSVFLSVTDIKKGFVLLNVASTATVRLEDTTKYKKKKAF